MGVVTVDGAVSLPPGLPALLDGRYLLGPLLGRGGAAEVFQAHDQVVDRAVAVKIFLSGVATTDSRRQHREIGTQAGFSHPGLVTLYDAGEVGGRAFFVMQLVQGRSLAERLREGPLPVAQTTHLGIVLADALAYVHEDGVVHRDVKPANVLLDQQNDPYLSDFGIATMIDSTQITSTGLMIGTAAYLAPEQVRGHPVGTDTDIYALGLLLLECLTGQREYTGNPMETALARLHRPPRIPEELTAPITDVLVAMTADDPAERPTAADVAEWLRNIDAPTGTTAVIAAAPPVPLDATVRTTPAAQPVPARARKRHRRILLAAAIMVILAIGSVLSLPLLSHTRAPAVSVPAVLPSFTPIPSSSLTPTTSAADSPQPAANPADELGASSPTPIPTTPAADSPPAGPTPPPQAVTTGPTQIPDTPTAASTPPPISPTAEPTPPSPTATTPTSPNPQPTPTGATQSPAPSRANGRAPNG